MRRLRHILLLLSLWLFAGADGIARNASEESDSLSRLSLQTLMDRGRHYFQQRQADEALSCFLAVSNRSQDSTQLRVRALNNIACVYKYFHRDNLKAYDYLTQAYRLCDSLHYDEFMPVIMVNMGDLINDNNATSHSEALSQQARDIFDQCMQRAISTRNWELMTTTFFNLSNQNYTLPLEKYQTLFSKEIPDSTPDLQYARLQYRGLEHIQQQRFAEARNCFEQQLAAISARWEPVRDSIATYTSIAYTYHQEHDYDHEIAYLDRALQVAESSDVGDQTAYIGQLQTAARANLLAKRQRVQQFVILGVGIILLIVLISAFLLWQKNRQLYLRNKSLFEKTHQVMKIEADEQNLRKAYSKSSLNDEQRETLIYRIQETLSDPSIICQQDFTLAKLSKLINSNTTYVSQVINEKYDMSFSNLLSSYRIKVACQWMDNPAKYGHLTIEAIATDTGFKSRTTFVNAFKRETGLKPSEYFRMATAKQAEKK